MSVKTSYRRTARRAAVKATKAEPTCRADLALFLAMAPEPRTGDKARQA